MRTFSYLLSARRPAQDLVNQPPPLSFRALTSFLDEHRTETKLVGHVLHALTRRMTECSDAEVRHHAAHDACAGDVLAFFADPAAQPERSVVFDVLGVKSRMEQESRACFYAALLVATMAKYAKKEVAGSV